MFNKLFYILPFVVTVFSAQSAQTWVGKSELLDKIYLYDIKGESKPLQIIDGVGGYTDSNETSKIICGGYAGTDEKIWMADLSKGILKYIFSSNPQRFYSNDSGIISTNDGFCIYINSENGVSISSWQGDTKQISLEGQKLEGDVSRLFYNDHLDETILMSKYGFYHLPKNKTINVAKIIKPFGVVRGYGIDSLGKFGVLANNGVDFYASAFISKPQNNGKLASIVKLNAKTGKFVSIVIPSDANGIEGQPKYKGDAFFLLDGSQSLLSYLGDDNHLYRIDLINHRLQKISDKREIKGGVDYVKKGGVLNSNILVSQGIEYRTWKTDIDKSISLPLDKEDKTVSYQGKYDQVSLSSVSHGNGGPDFMAQLKKPEITHPKKVGDKAYLLDIYAVCTSIGKSPDNKCGGAKFGVPVIVVRLSPSDTDGEKSVFAQIKLEDNDSFLLWTPVENLEVR